MSDPARPTDADPSGTRAGIPLVVGVLLYLLARLARRRGEPLDDDRPGEAAAPR